MAELEFNTEKEIARLKGDLTRLIAAGEYQTRELADRSRELSRDNPDFSQLVVLNYTTHMRSYQTCRELKEILIGRAADVVKDLLEIERLEQRVLTVWTGPLIAQHLGTVQ